MRRSPHLLAPMVWAFIMGGTASAQEEGSGAEQEGPHEIVLAIGHSWIGQGLNAEGHRSVLAAPSWCLNYNYWLNERWAIGLHTDLVNEEFVVERFDDEEALERDRPVAPALMATYRPHEHWSFILGGGMEFASEENLTLFRAEPNSPCISPARGKRRPASPTICASMPTTASPWHWAWRAGSEEPPCPASHAEDARTCC